MRIDLPRRFYVASWVAWVVMFVVVEGLALLDRDNGETLTAQVRDLFWRYNKRPNKWFAPLHVMLVAWYEWHIHTEQRGRGAG